MARLGDAMKQRPGVYLSMLVRETMRHMPPTDRVLQDIITNADTSACMDLAQALSEFGTARQRVEIALRRLEIEIEGTP